MAGAQGAGKMSVEAIKEVRRALILTAIPLETRATFGRLREVSHVYSNDGDPYLVGWFEGQRARWEVSVVEMGAGNVGAGVIASKAIQARQPDVVLFSGIAGHLKDTMIGDVAVGEGLYYYEMGSSVETGFIVRPREYHPSQSLLKLARIIGTFGTWKDRLDQNLHPRTPEVHIGRLASGEQVIRSSKSPIRKMLAENYPDALAVEMEGAGVLKAAEHHEGTKALVVRAISDYLDDKSGTDEHGFQHVAADSAAAFTFEILNLYEPPPTQEKVSVSSFVELSADGAERCSWTGHIAHGDITSLWEGPPPIDVLRLRLSDRAAPLALRQALLRVLCHIPDVSPLAIEVEPGSGWRGRYSELVGRPNGASFSGWQPEWREASAAGATPQGDIVAMTDMAEILHDAMDEWSFAKLDTTVQDILTRTPGMAHRIIVEEVLGDELLGLWRTWRQDMDEATRARFMALLVTLREDTPLPRDVAIGPRMIDSMAAGAVLALALAHCGGFAASVAGHPGLCPCADSPGNLAVETLRCHSTGVQHWKDKRVGHLRISDLEGVRARLLLLAQHEGEFRIEVATQRALGAASVSTSLGSNSLSRPAVLTYDGDFAEALKEGKASVERYLRKRFVEESLQGQAILDALEKSA